MRGLMIIEFVSNEMPLSRYISYMPVLVLPVIELNFFIVTCTGLYFGFVMTKVLITQACFSYCLTVFTER